MRILGKGEWWGGRMMGKDEWWDRENGGEGGVRGTEVVGRDGRMVGSGYRDYG